MGWDPYEEDPAALEPDGVESLSGCIIRHGKYSYYIAPRWIWFLDYYKYCLAQYTGYSKDEFDPDLQLRFGIYTVDEKHEDEYFRCMEPYKRSCERMRYDLKLCLSLRERYNYTPEFLIDFDKKFFLSRFWEPYEPEKYVPDGWQGKWQDFPDEIIPEEYRFWIDENGVDLLEVFEE